MGDGSPAVSEPEAADRELEQLFNLSVGMLCIAGTNGYFKRVNAAFERTLGFTAAELLARPFVELVHPEDRQRTLDEVGRLAQGIETIHFENRYRCRDGSYRWLAWTGMPRPLEGLIYATALDVTERKQAEQLLCDSEQRYRQLLAAATTYTYTVRWHGEGLIATEHGRGCLAATGYSPEDYASDPLLWIKMVHPDDREAVLAHVARVRAGEDVPPLEHRIVHRDGSVRWLRDTIVLHRDASGSPTGYDGVVEDVTERRQVENRFRQLWESAPDAMAVVDHHGTIAQVNAPLEKLFGYRREDLLGQPIEVLVPERARHKHRGQRADYAARPHVRPMGVGMELAAVRKDGSEFPAEVSLAPLQTDEGLLTFTAIRDVTERRRAAREIETNLYIQRATAAILRLSLEPGPLETMLGQTLDLLFSIPWIALQSKGCIFLVEDEPDVLVMKAHRGMPPDLLAECGRVPSGKCLCGRAAAGRGIVFVDGLDARHEIRYPGIEGHGHYCVPMVYGGRLYGVINLYVRQGQKQRPEEETLLASVADVLAGTIERKRAEGALRETQVQLLAAQRIQEHLLPRAAPLLSGFDVAGASYPAELTGGDYFDYLPMRDGSLGLVIADVSGHGFGSALLMASTHAHLRSLAEAFEGLDEIVTRANAVLSRETEDDRFVTLLFGRLDPRSGRLEYVNAGHPAGYVLDASGAVKASLESTSLPLGILADADFPCGPPVALEPGDLVLFLTDGVLEARSPEGEPFGTERALDVVRAARHKPASGLIATLCEAVRQFAGQSKLPDDLTALVVKVGLLPAASPPAPSPLAGEETVSHRDFPL